MWYLPGTNFTMSAQVTVQYKEFENDAIKIFATFLWGQWVKAVWIYHRKYMKSNDDRSNTGDRASSDEAKQRPRNSPKHTWEALNFALQILKPLCDWIFIEISIYFCPIFHTEIAQVVEILPHWKQGPNHLIINTMAVDDPTLRARASATIILI